VLLGGWCSGGRWPVFLAAVGGGVGPYLDPAPWCGVFSLVGGLIVQRCACRLEEASLSWTSEAFRTEPRGQLQVEESSPL
jgi:hypothetical protein